MISHKSKILSYNPETMVGSFIINKKIIKFLKTCFDSGRKIRDPIVGESVSVIMYNETYPLTVSTIK